MTVRSIFLAVLALACVARVQADEQPHDIGEISPPSGAKFLCSGRVYGQPEAPGTPGTHVLWNAYTSTETVERVAAHYQDMLKGSPTDEFDGRGCRSWSVKEGAVQRVYEVCSSGAPGPWSECAAPSSGTLTIILTSLMIGG